MNKIIWTLLLFFSFPVNGAYKLWKLFPETAPHVYAQEINYEVRITNYELCPSPIIKCNHYLTQKAIAKSLLIQSLQQKIKTKEEQIKYLNGEVKHYKSRSWTDYITLQPLEILENLFGGGKARETKLKIIDLETKVSELEDNKIQLENQLIIASENIKNEITIALINIEENQKTIELMDQKIKKTKLQNRIFLIKYSNGEGTTNQYLHYQDKIDQLDFDLIKATNNYNQTISKLLLLTDN